MTDPRRPLSDELHTIGVSGEASSCCAPAEHVTCCDAEEKPTCCGARLGTEGGGCGCLDRGGVVR